MKALTLWEPWATAMALGLKRNETRPRRWSYRGDLAICSARRPVSDLGCCIMALHELDRKVKFGFVLCVVTVTDCLATDEVRLLTDQEHRLGNYQPGRFVYLTNNLRRLAVPIPVIGRQGLFNLPPDIEARVLSQIK